MAFQYVLNNSSELYQPPSTENCSYNICSESELMNDNDTIQYYLDSNTTAMFYYYVWTYGAPALFSLIILIGTAGNLLVVYVILSKPSMRTTTNFMLLNLAIADISFLLICVPFTTYKYISFEWPFGDLSCKFVQYFLYVSAYVTVYTLVSISVLRFITVVYSTKTIHYRTKTNVIIVNVLIWCVMLLVNVPTLLSHRLKHFHFYTYCGMEAHAIKPVFVSFFVFAYALPLIVICVLYLLILSHLQKTRRSSSIRRTHANDRTSRACKVLVLVVVVFAISWLPCHVNSLVATYGRLPQGQVYELFRILWFSMAYGNSCANPIIYNFSSKEFRKGFREVVCCRGVLGLRQRSIERPTESTIMMETNGNTVA